MTKLNDLSMSELLALREAVSLSSVEDTLSDNYKIDNCGNSDSEMQVHLFASINAVLAEKALSIFIESEILKKR